MGGVCCFNVCLSLGIVVFDLRLSDTFLLGNAVYYGGCLFGCLFLISCFLGLGLVGLVWVRLVVPCLFVW